MASGAIMKLAWSRPALKDSTMVGKSVNNCDSKREVALVRVAKSVTGQVRWHVTGRKPTVSVSRACNIPADPRCHGLYRTTARTARNTTDPAIQRAADDRNKFTLPPSA